MIVVQFNRKTKGPCSWCGREKDELFDVVFGDKSFMGQYCKNDLLKAIGMKLTGTPVEQPKGPAATPANGPPVAAR